MASNWAIVIGINQYRFLQPLKYAKRDAEAMQSFLNQEAKFDRIFLFTDDSPHIGGKPTEPFRANLLRVLRQIFASPSMKDGDNFWLFFSGHGIPHNGQDYLMPLDGDPEDIENTGISTNIITNYLRSCGADNAVMILDACRSGGKKSGEGIGRQTESEARQTGVISLFSCSPDQYSYELEAIEQGAFTHALLEGLGIRGKCATVERLNQYLEHRVPELVSQHLGRVRQIPYTIAEPLNRSHLILMPQHANLADITTMKNDAYRAERKQDWDLAQRLWIRVNAAASGEDMEAIEALQNLHIKHHAGNISPQAKFNQASEFQTSTKQKADEQNTLSSTQLKKPLASHLLARQQFLKGLISVILGVIGVTLASQFLRTQSPQTSPSPTSETQSPQTSPSPTSETQLPQTSPSPTSYPTSRSSPTLNQTPTSIATQAPTPSPNAAETKREVYVQRLTITPDSSINSSGNLRANETIIYIIAGEQGQVLSATLSVGGVLMTVLGSDKRPLGDAAKQVAVWQGVLPYTSDFYIELSPIKGLDKSDYQLEVSLKNGW